MTANLSPDAMGLQSISSVPIAVVDVETTGLTPGADRVVEVAVAKVDPGGRRPRLVLESLVNPLRSMAATEIHGVTQEAVAEAPHFRDLAGDLLDALSGCCVAGYNANFDIGMLRWEFRQCGVESFAPPYICLKHLRARLGLGGGTLEDACRDHEVPFYAGHFAAYDALAEGELLVELLPILEERGIEKFGHLMSGGPDEYKFVESLLSPPLPRAAAYGLETGCRRLKRSRDDDLVPDSRKALGIYHDALVAVVADSVVTDEEMNVLAKLRKRFALRPEQYRSLHARLFASFISIYADDEWLADSEAGSLHKLYRCLEEAGWAPGNKV